MALQPNSASGSGALEHDSAYLFHSLQQGQSAPGPLPLGVAVIDSSVTLFGLVFPRVPQKHRLQMLEHFLECIRQAKSGRQQAVQTNVFTAVLCALKCLAESKTGFGQVEIRRAAFNLVMGAMGSSNPILRCAAGEALGRMAQVVGENRFIAEMAQHSFDRLKSARDTVTRTGHSLALGCLHRYVGGMGSGPHLSTSVSILLALAQDSSSPAVQVWALHALSLIADSGGPMFRSYVEPALSLVLQLLLTVPTSHVDVHQCLGKCLAALITTIGPELQGNSAVVSAARLSCLVCCAVMQDHDDALVTAEAISCLQQLHMFAPRHVNLSSLVPYLCETLQSSHLLLRRAAVSCLRQLTQREASEVAEHALQMAAVRKEGVVPVITETGLEGALFRLLDAEWDAGLVRDTQDTLVSLLQSLVTSRLTQWLSLVRTILQASTATDSSEPQAMAAEDPDREDDDDDAGELTVKTKKKGDVEQRTVAPRWPTRVFALDCLLKIISACGADPGHYDLAEARQQRALGRGDRLVLHLAELVRMAFIAATSDSDQLRLAGLAALAEIISRFARVPEPEFPGHLILEQYQAQVGAALRPAFSPDTTPDVTAAACEVCSSWIGSGVARDLNDLRRVHQLLVSSLTKLKDNRDQTPLYSEAAGTMERLAVLRAWAEVYIMAIQQQKEIELKKLTVSEEEAEWGDAAGESLLSLVQPEMTTLSRHWLAALRDHALISLPSEFTPQLPPEGGTFFTMDTMEAARPYYRAAWPSVLCAVCLWLQRAGFTSVNKDADRPANMQSDAGDTERMHLLLGVAMEALCGVTSVHSDDTARLCLRALAALLEQPWPRGALGANRQLSAELLNVLHRQLLTRESADIFLLVIDVTGHVVGAAREQLEDERAKAKDKAAADAVEESEVSEGWKTLGEGRESGDIPPAGSVVFAALEVCLQALVRYYPTLSGADVNTVTTPPVTSQETTLISAVLTTLAELPKLCSPRGILSILPTLFHLNLGVLKETAASQCSGAVTSALQALKQLCQCTHGHADDVTAECVSILQAAVWCLLEGQEEDTRTATSDLDPAPARLDQATLTLALSILLTSSPPEVLAARSVVTSCVDVYSAAWRSKSTQTRLACAKALCVIFAVPARQVSAPFIRTCAAPVIHQLLQSVPAKLEFELELNLVQEGLKCLETLVSAATSQQKLCMLSLLIPILVSYLSDDVTKEHKLAKVLHQHALAKLTQIGPMYPDQTRNVLQSRPDWKQKLEAAVRGQAASRRAELRAGAAVTAAPAQPTIRLKTDFSGFG